MKTKKCTKCGEVKELNYFCKDVRLKDGKCIWCKSCRALIHKKWREKNKDHIKEYREVNKEKIKIQRIGYRLKNNEAIRKKSLEYFYNNKEEIKEKSKIYREKNKEFIKLKNRKWYEENKERILSKNKKWRDSNREKHRKYKKDFRHTVKGNIDNRMSGAIRRSLKNGKKGCRWEALAGYSVDDLKSHLEKQFTDEMSWEAFMDGKIHIDHIRPLASFNYYSIMDEQFRMCWSLENLQPLWAEDNMSKWCNWDENSLSLEPL